MSEPIKIQADVTGKVAVDALGSSINALDAKLSKLTGTAVKSGEAAKFLEAELRKVQKTETGRVTAVTSLTQNIDALQAEITKLGRVGGATALKREFDSIKSAFNSFDNVGFKSIDQINKFRADLDQALGRVGEVLGKKRGLTQGQFDLFVDVAKAVDSSGKKVRDKVTTESEAIERAIAASGKRQAAAIRLASAEKARAEVQAADVTAQLLAQKGQYTPYNANSVKPVYGTKMSLDETRRLLGMPDRNEMKTFAAQLKSQMADELSTAKLRAGSATKMSLDETRRLLGMPDRAAVSAASAELRRWMEEDAAKAQALVKATSRQQLTTPITGAPLGSFSTFSGSDRGALNIPTVPKSAASDLLHLDKMKLRLDDLHSAARGVASGFGAMWLTWGNLMPLLAGAALSNSVVQVVKLGAAVQNTTEIMRVLGEESAQSIGKLNVQLLELARNGPFGPLEVAEAMKTLTLAGLSAAEVGTSIKDVLNFAVAGDTSIAKSADVLTSVAKAFGIAADGYNYVADVIAKTAAVSKSSVESIGEAFKTASVINKQYGVSLVDVGTGLAALSNLGIQGTAAGVALRNMYVDLSGRTVGTRKLLKEFNLELRDNYGNFKDIITITGDVNRVLDSFQTNIAKKDFLQKALSERGAKPIIELLDLARRASKETGETVGTELEKLRTRIQESAGFVIVAAAQMALTPLNQMKSVAATMQSAMVEAFAGLEPVILSVAGQLKAAFNSSEFQTALQNLIAGIASLTLWLMDHAKAIGIVIEAYLAFKAVALVAGILGGVERAILSVGVAAGTASVGVARFTGALGLVTRFLGPLTAVVTVAWGAWELYGMFTGKAKDKLAALAGSSYSDQLIAKLKEETRRLEENTEAKRKNISIEQLREQNELQSLEKKTAEQATAKVVAAEAAANKAEQELAEFKKTHAKAAAFGSADYTQALYLTNEAAKAKAAVSGAKSEMAQVIRNVEAAKADAKSAAAVLEAYVLRDKAAQDRVSRGSFGNVTLKDGGSDRSAAFAAHNAEKGFIAEIKKEQEEAAKEIAGYKAQAAQQVAAAALAEKQLISEVTAAHLDGIEARRTAALSIETAVAQGTQSEAEGKTALAAIKLASNQAELQQIQAVTSATLARYAAEHQAARIAHELEGERLRKSLSIQRQLAEGMQRKHGSDPAYAKEIADAVGQVKVLQQNLDTWNHTTKEIDAATQNLVDTAVKGTEAYTAKVREQNKALDDQLLAAKKNLKTLQDEYANRGKGTARLREEAAVRAELLALSMRQQAQSLREAGSASAAQAEIQAQIAETEAAAARLAITNSRMLNTDWYSATNKALEDYASSLENVAGEIANVFTKTFKGLEDVIVDFITKGKADFKGFVTSILADMARIAVRQNIIMPMLSWMAGGSGGGQSFGGSLAGGIGNSIGGSLLGGGSSGVLSNIGNTVGGWFGAGGAMSAGTGIAASVGTGTTLAATGGGLGLSAGAASTGYGFTAGGGLGLTAGSAGASTIGAGLGTSAAAGGSGAAAAGGSSVLAAIPVWGWIALAAIAIASQAKGETRSGGQYSYDKNSGVSSLLQGPSGGEIEGSTVKAAISGTAAGINGLLKGVGSTATIAGFQAGLESSDRGRGGVFSGGTLSTGATFGESGKGNNYEGTLYEKTSSQSVDSKTALTNFTTDLMQVTIQALQAATDIPKTISDMVKGVDAESLSSEAATALVTTIQTTVNGVASLKDAMETMNLETLSFDAAAGLIKAAGGIDKLGASLSTYYDKFYSAEEKAAASTKNTATAFSKLGITMPAVNSELRVWYRGQVESALALDQTIVANAEATAGVLALAGAVDSLSPAADSAIVSMKDFVSNVMTLVNGIHESVSGSIFDMKYGLQDNQGKYGMLDTVAKGYDDKMRSATDINIIAEMAQKEIDTINKAWDLLDAEQQAAKLSEMVALLEKVDTFVTQSGADAISLKKSENQDLADTIATAVEEALAELTTRLADAAIAQAAATSQFAAAKSEPAQVNVTVNNRSSSEVSIS